MCPDDYAPIDGTSVRPGEIGLAIRIRTGIALALVVSAASLLVLAKVGGGGGGEAPPRGLHEGGAGASGTFLAAAGRIADKVAQDRAAPGEWEIVFPAPINVRAGKDFASQVLEMKNPGDVVVGSQSDDGFWIKLLGTDGFIATNYDGTDIVKKREAQYWKLSHWTCESQGLSSILNVYVCMHARNVLQAESADRHAFIAPDGCYFKPPEQFGARAANTYCSSQLADRKAHSMQPTVDACKAECVGYQACSAISYGRPGKRHAGECVLCSAVETATNFAFDTYVREWGDSSSQAPVYGRRIAAEGGDRSLEQPPETGQLPEAGEARLGVDEPICSSLAYPIENTTATSTTTTTTPPTHTRRTSTTTTPPTTTPPTTTPPTTTPPTTTPPTTTPPTTTPSPAQARRTSATRTTSTRTRTRTRTTTASRTASTTRTTSTHKTTSTSTTIVTTTTTKSLEAPTLFCFSAFLAHTMEQDIMKLQLEGGRGIFACETAIMLSNEEVVVGVAPDGTEVKSLLGPSHQVELGHISQVGVTTDSWLNTAIFIRAFDIVLNDTEQRVFNHDFTIKVDPDAVLFPDRLKAHIREHSGKPVFFLNCDIDGTGLLYGALEIFSREAMKIYDKGKNNCTAGMAWEGWGEDYYFQECMTFLGVESVMDSMLVGDERCNFAPCGDGWSAAFHPYKDVESYNRCWAESVGWILADDDDGGGEPEASVAPDEGAALPQSETM